MDRYEKVAFEVTKSDGTLNGTEGKMVFRINDEISLIKWSGRSGYKIPALGIETSLYNRHETGIYELFKNELDMLGGLISDVGRLTDGIKSLIKKFNEEVR